LLTKEQRLAEEQDPKATQWRQRNVEFARERLAGRGQSRTGNVKAELAKQQAERANAEASAALGKIEPPRREPSKRRQRPPKRKRARIPRNSAPTPLASGLIRCRASGASTIQAWCVSHPARRQSSITPRGGGG